MFHDSGVQFAAMKRKEHSMHGQRGRKYERREKEIPPISFYVKHRKMQDGFLLATALWRKSAIVCLNLK
jgi:hypothetical protein